MVKVPASCASLNLKRVYRALVATHGNTTAAAKKLRVPPADLRLLIRAVPAVHDAALEAEERALDKAEAVIVAALDGPDVAKRLAAAAYLLKTSEAGQRRGWGPKAS
jgi:hypothetical protein